MDTLEADIRKESVNIPNCVLFIAQDPTQIQSEKLNSSYGFVDSPEGTGQSPG